MYDALIIANGELPSPDLWARLPYKRIICTDGSANSLHPFSIIPHIIIGDMDSITKKQAPHPTTQLLTISDQNTTDFEKALLFCAENKLSRVLCIGILGKSADHSVYNLSLLIRFADSLELMALSVYENNLQWIFPLRETTRIESETGATISLVPYPETTLSTQGLKWNLNNETLDHTHRHSIRNKTTQNVIQVHSKGHCLAFLTSPTLPLIHYPTN